MKEFNIIAKGDVSLVLKKTDLVLPTNTKKKLMKYGSISKIIM